MTSQLRLGLLVVAAGSSSRMEGVDKLWVELGGRPLIAHALHRLSARASRSVLVVRPDVIDRAFTLFQHDPKGVTVVGGGPERQDSVRNGLQALGDVNVVAVQDAARPFSAVRLLDAGLACLDRADAAIPVVPVKDTVKEVDAGGVVVRTLDRSRLCIVQTPQLFRCAVLRRAHEAARVGGTSAATDDAALVEAIGGRVVTFPGSDSNLKVTTPADLEFARLLFRSLGEE